MSDREKELEAGLRLCQEALALMVNPDAIKTSSTAGAFYKAVAAEAKARSLLAPRQAAPVQGART